MIFMLAVNYSTIRGKNVHADLAELKGDTSGEIEDED